MPTYMRCCVCLMAPMSPVSTSDLNRAATSAAAAAVSGGDFSMARLSPPLPYRVSTTLTGVTAVLAQGVRFWALLGLWPYEGP